MGCNMGNQLLIAALKAQLIVARGHLSKEALEAADDVGDLSEWADMQFLLWDAQRRAGISDQEITAAMEEKLKVNMAREWPEPKDGEPRLHIKP